MSVVGAGCLREGERNEWEKQPNRRLRFLFNDACGRSIEARDRDEATFRRRSQSMGRDLSRISGMGRRFEQVELDIAFFAKQLGHIPTSDKFLKASSARLSAMYSIFWNKEMNQWLDYWLNTSNSDCKYIHQFEARNQNDKIFASNFIPLWTSRHNSGSVEDGTMVERVLQSFQKSGLLYPAGIAASLSKSGQQWDFPMGWAPLQHMIIEGFSKSGSKAAWTLAEDIAIRWIRTNFAAYKTSGKMYEKYDVVGCGKIGTDGVYKPKTGFGWSNGVVLSLLEEFGWPSDREIACQ